MMSTARGSSSSSGSNKQQRNVKGFVKRCRSFKEDIISRLARNRSTSGADDISSGRGLTSRSGIASPSSWSSKSPTPGDDSSVEPTILISHRLKEVNLTLHFVESLIQKNCVELLGGSSNVMLDLMGCLFNDIKKMPSSDSAQFQSIISQLKTVLSDFLTAVDALLLKEGYDDAQRELYFEKVHESIATSRDALSGLRNLIDSNTCSSSASSLSSPFPPLKPTNVLSPDHALKPSNNALIPPPVPPHASSSPQHQASTANTTSPTRSNASSSKSANNGDIHTHDLSHTPSSSTVAPQIEPPPTEAEEKKPPLPPKSKQFSRRSFDSDWPDSLTPTSAGPSSPRRMQLQQQNNHRQYDPPPPAPTAPSLVVAPVVSLDQWLEQSNRASSSTPSSSGVRVTISNTCDPTSSSVVVTSMSTSASSAAYHHSYQLNSSSSTGTGGLLTTSQYHPQRDSSDDLHSDPSSPWTHSAIYMSRPTTHSTASDSISRQAILSTSSASAVPNKARNRTYSDSYQLEYDDTTGTGHLHHHPHHLHQYSSNAHQYHSAHHDLSSNHIDRIISADYERRSVKSGTTHNSLSLSLGSSLDNLLLVDAQSQQSGLSPNSNTSGTGCTGAMHSLSGSSAGNHPSDATGRLTGNFPDFEVDEDVFVTEVVDGCSNKSSGGRYQHLPLVPITRLSKQAPVVVDDSDNEVPPELPEKRRINKHYTTIDHSYLGGTEPGYSCFAKQQQQYNARCHSPYDNVDENDSILNCWPGGVATGQPHPQHGQPPFMPQSESRVTLVGQGGNDTEERPPLPPKKKHSLIAAYVEFMHNFDLHSQRHQQHFCNHYAASRPNHHFLKDQEGISSSEENSQYQSHLPLSQQGFHRHYLAERSATMFNPCTGEIPGFSTATTSSSAAARCLSSYVSGSGGGGINKAALYSASYHHFSTFSNSSIPSEENSPTHQHFPLTGSSSSTSHSLSEHMSGGENGGGVGGGSETKPPLPPKKSRSILKGLLGDLSKDSSQETDTKSINGGTNNLNCSSNGHPSPLSPTSAPPPQPTNLPLGNINSSKSNHQSPVKQQTLTSQSPRSPGLAQAPRAGSVNSCEGGGGATGGTAVSNNNNNNNDGGSNAEASKNTNGSMGKSPQRSLDDDSIDLFMIDATPLLVFSNKSSTSANTKSSPPTSTSTSGNNSNANSNSNSNSEGHQEVKGAEPMVLLVYAASPDVVDSKFRETFLLTYRNFLRPSDVVHLLWKRFKHFENKSDRTSMIHMRATLDLYVDVVIGLTPMDLDDEMVSRVRKCIYHLVCSGEIQSALKARKGIIHKYQVRLKILKPQPAPASLAVTTESQSLLKWSATSIAQQMTLLDADLFRELEPAELLLWAREQVEDLCPALNNFTEHFNKVSYWTRTRVLMCSTSRERNRTMKKLIGVMRKLREYNNFNSLLAVLAALDSAPIRRLGFSRRLTEALKPHAALTDSSGSFRTYRQALADCHPPCIPYIGLVLQDLTFVHIGNPDFLQDGKVNWVKRLQQWVILEPIRRLHLCHYGFSRNDGLLAFLNNFDEHLSDDDLWQLSESIKPQTKNN